MKLHVSLFLSLFLFLPLELPAQSVPPVVRTDYDMRELAKPPALSAQELNGRKLFAQYCSLCHDPVGHEIRLTYGPLLDRNLLHALGKATVRAQILQGSLRMPGFQYQLKPAQIDAILVFLKHYSSPASRFSERKPTSERERIADGKRISEERRHSISVLSGNSLLSGSIRGATGEVLAGVAVSAQAEGSTVTTTVFTDGQGRFEFPSLAEGSYSLWAQAVGYAAARSKVSLKSRARDLSLQLLELKNPDELSKQLSGAEWLDALPERTPEERRHKEMFRLSCTDCHEPSVPLQRRFDEHGWQATTRFMLHEVSVSGWVGPTSAGGSYEGQAGSEVDKDRVADEIAKYLASVRGPHSPPLPFKLLPRPAGPEAQVVITGYDIPPAETPHERSWQDGRIWSEGAATGMHSAVGIHDVITDARGNAWLTESVHDRTRTILEVDAKSGQVRSFYFVPPSGVSYQELAVHGIGRDSKGNVWFPLMWRGTDGTPDGELIKIDAASGAVERFAVPASMRNVFWDITVDSDAKDRIWMSAVSGTIRFDPATATFSYWHNLTPELNPNVFTYGTTGDAAGNGWWTVPDADRVETVNPTTGETHAFVMHPPWASAELIPGSGGDWLKAGAQYPRRLGADKNGTDVWVPNYFGRNLARIDIRSKAISYYRVPIDSHPYYTRVDRRHVVWMNLMSDDRVAAFDPSSQQWRVYRLPVNGCESRDIALDDRTGDVWVPCFRASQVFRLQFRAQPPAHS